MERRNITNPLVIGLSIALVIMAIALAVVWTDSVTTHNEIAKMRTVSTELGAMQKAISGSFAQTDATVARMDADSARSDLKEAQTELAKVRAEIERDRAELERLQSQLPPR